MKLWKKILLGAGGVGVVAFIGLQLIPVEGVNANPPGRYVLDAPPEVEGVLRKACMDCHSNETRWPWYSRMAPASWLVMRDVRKGRSRMNMSEWGETDEEERALDRESSWEQIESGEMPPWFYIPMHPDARLSAREKELLKGWLLAKRETPDDKELVANKPPATADTSAPPPIIPTPTPPPPVAPGARGKSKPHHAHGKGGHKGH